MARVTTRKGTKQRARQPAASARPLMEELEPRLLLSADPASALGTTAALHEAELQPVTPLFAADTAQGNEAPAIEARRRELIIIDPTTPDYERLLADLGTEAADGTAREVVVLQPDEDGVAQLTDILSRYSDLSAIHLISHGADGEISIGNGVLNLDGVLANVQAIQGWGQALTADGDLLIYGCNVVADGDGQILIETLGRLTGADVAASDGLTGSASLGGDWDLEAHVGAIETLVAVSNAFQQQWLGVLVNYAVTNTSDSGAGSLRDAIAQSNASVGVADTITFSIGSGAQTITLGSTLTISDQVTIDGWSQPGFAGNPLIRIDGSLSGFDGLTMTNTSDGSVVQGLGITRFNDGIVTQAGADNITIRGNWIGTTGSGTGNAGRNTDDGIELIGNNALIGGTGANDRNVITNNADEGIDIKGSGVTGHVIRGNYIGVDPDGSSGGGNVDVGIAVYFGSGNTIGGLTAAERNVISRNNEGIEIRTDNNVVQGNYIGTDSGGTIPRGNQVGDGIQVVTGNNNQIGGTASGAGNLIAFNAGDGVDIAGGTGNSVLGNRIYSNTLLGINLDAAGIVTNDPGDGDGGANNLQNFPALTSANSNAAGTTIVGSLNSNIGTTYRIEFYASRPSVADGSNGEGERYLGFVDVVTNGSGNATINTTLANVWVNAGDRITATATSAGGDTSEFAVNVTATSTGIVVVDTISDVSDSTNLTSITNLGNNRGPDGRISLREAIIAANNTAGVDKIVFNIPGTGVHTINVGAAGLPTITQAVIIDGWSEPDYAGSPVIELNGGNLGTLVKGITLGAGSDGSTIRGLIINRFTGTGIEISGSSNHTIQGNWIGLDSTGTAAAGNAVKGIYGLNSTGNLIGGTTAAQRNVISGNAQQGIYFDNVDNSTISGNYVGTNAAGTGDVNGAVANTAQSGVFLTNGSSGNVVGGTTAGARNILSGNNHFGLEVLFGSQNNLLQGNYIGTDVTGLVALGNINGGAVFWNAGTGNVLGGSVAGARNVIAGNTYNGVVVGNASTAAVIEGNYIGVGADGVTDLGNGSSGVKVEGGSTGTRIGTNADGSNDAAEGNVISGNTYGVRVSDSGTNGTVIAGNIIGLAADGSTIVANSSDGVSVVSSAGATMIGGATSVSRNVISGNAGFGVYIGSSTSGSSVLSNYIGTNAAGTAARANLDGVWIDGSANNIIGQSGAGNVISGSTYFGVVVSAAGANGNTIHANLIGTNATGTAAISNGGDGVKVEGGAIGTIIGGTAAGDRNLISGNAGNGILVSDAGTTGTLIRGNYIGTDASGTAAIANAGGGIRVETANNTIGGTAAGSRNVISGNANHGVFLIGANATGNVVQGNYIGTNASGAAAVGNLVHGVALSGGASNNLIGGTTAAERNVISGNQITGVRLLGATTNGNTIAGNFIGVDNTGAAVVGNGSFGVIADAPNTTIGGTVTGAGNVISGNASNGVQIEANGSGSLIQGNYIGTDSSGTLDRGNLGAGIYLNGTTNVTIGSAAAGARNVISGNTGNGIYVAGGSAHVIAGNYIGTNAAGAVALGNDVHGILVSNSANNLIGGTSAAERNVVSGNIAYGIAIAGASATGNTISANYVGLNAAGTAAIGNVFGVDIEGGATSNTIGGLTAGARNVISGNSTSGVLIQFAGTSGNQVLGNYIGTDATGSAAVANLLSGVDIKNGATNNIVGGTANGASNLISGNGGAGVVIASVGTTGNAVLGNSISANTGLGIDLNSDGVTPNDADDVDPGQNNLQNFPVLSSARVVSGTQLAVAGTINSTANSHFRIEFFASAAADGTGYGEGQSYLGFVNVTTDGSGNASFSTTLTTSVAAGSHISATATKSDATFTAFTDTSEFAQNLTALSQGIRVTPISVVPIGGETLVNSNTTDIQTISPNVAQAIATDANGNYIVVWASNVQDGGLYGIYAQRYSADGTAQGSEFRVNTTAVDSQLNPSVAMDTSGNFVVTWSSNNQDGSGWGIYAQRYDAAGVAQGSEFLVNATTAGGQTTPAVAMSPAGAFVITWSSSAQDPDGSSGIYAQRFNASGVAQGGEFRVNTYTTNAQQLASIAMDASGNFVVTWGSTGQDGSGSGVYGQRFDAIGVAQGVEFRVNTTTAGNQLYHDVAVLADGRFVVVYQSDNGGVRDLFMQRYAADGTAVGGEVQVNTVSGTGNFPIPSVAADASGNITVVWNSSADGAGAGVFARRFDGSGTPLTSQFQVNTTTAGDQWYPEVVAQPGGGFIVAWGGNGPGDANGVFLQRYGLTTTEGGGTATFQIVLEAAPTADVTIPISVSDGSEGSVSVGSVTFNSGNWNVAQTVTITGLQDFINDGTQRYQVVLGAATSSDANFSGLNPADLWVTNLEIPNTAPVHAIPGDQTTNEDTNLVFSTGNGNAISISDADAGGGTVNVLLAATNGTITLNGTTGLSFITGDGTGDALLNFTGTIASINTALNGLIFAPTSNYIGAASLQIITGDMGNSGTGGALGDSDTVNITVNPVNDAPALSATGLNPTFTEAAGLGTQAAAVSVFSSATASTVEAGQTISGLTLTVSGLVDGSNEVIVIDGQTITLGVTSSGTTATNGLAFTSTVSAGTATIELSGGTLSTAAAQTLVNGITYQNTSTDIPTPGNRIFTVTQVRDSGGTANGGVDTTALAIASTVTVTALNDTPVAADDRPSLNFDGIDDYVSVPNSASLTMGATMTLEAWINPDVSSNVVQMIANKEGEYELSIFADGSLNVAFAEGGTWNWHDTGATIERNVWTHVAVTYDAGVVTTYVNGVAVDSQSMATTTIDDVYPGLDELLIGGRSNNPANQYFDGRIAEVRVWNVARSGAEISGAMNSTLTGSETGLAAYLPLNDNTGLTATDRTANGNDGTLINGAAWYGWRINEDSVLNAVVPGVLGNDYDVDGDTLTAVLVSGPANGSLTLNANGSFVYTPNANWHGTDSFTYRANDGVSDSNVATVNITVNPMADTPSVTGAATAEDTQTNAGLVISRNAADGAEVTHFQITGIANGTLYQNDGTTVIDNGDFITFAQGSAGLKFTPSANGIANGSFTVQASTSNAVGGLGGSTVNATITVTPVADTPAVTGATTNEDTQTTSGLVITRNAGDGAEVTHFQITGIANGTLYQNDGTTAINNGDFITFAQGNAGLKFTPAADFSGNASFTVQASTSNAVGGLAGATVNASITVTAVNDAPTTSPVTLAAIAEDSGPRLITQAELLANAIDVDGPSLTATGLTLTSGLGSLVDNGDGTWTYTPALNDDTAVTFSYTVTDGTTPVAGSATLDITPVNNPPVTTPVTLVAIGEDSGARLITQAELLANATDVDGPSLTATNLAISSGLGSLVDNGDGTWTYTPALNDDTGVTFSYTVTDGTTPVAGSATLDITPVNDPPVTTPVTLAPIGEDSGPRLITQAELLANASDVDGPGLTATGLAIASGLGSLVDNGDGTWTYTPALSDDTSVSFSYTVTDGSLTAAGTAGLDITPVNDAPVTTLVTLAAIGEDTGPRLITQAELLVNATDVDGPSLTATGLSISSGLGTLVDNGDGTWTYTPALNDDTAVTFSYTVTDGTTPVAGSATLDITPVNDPPATTPVTLAPIVEDSGPRLITQAELLANATDVDGPSLTATGLAITAGSGTLVDNGDGTWTYTPALNDDTGVTFSYTVTDGSLTAAGSATLDITPFNNPPVTTPVTLLAIGEDSGPRVITQAELLANATDVDGPSLTATGLAITAGSGTLIDNGDGTWTYTPALNDDTAVSFSYTVTDGSLSVAGSATLDITPVNNSPSTSPVTLTAIAEDSGPRLITQAELLANASDVDGPSLTATGLTITAGSGTLVDNGDGTWTYTPALNDDTSVSLSYTVTDGTTPVAGSATLDITPVNDPPATTPVTLAPIGEDSGPRVITQAELLANATDVDGPSLTANGLAIATGSGTLVDNGDGTWTYTPALNDDTGISFSYTITDGTTPVAGSATLDITPVNDAPATTPVTLAPIVEDSGPRLITQAELLANATDVDGPSLTATGLTISSGLGTLVDNGDGTWTYTPVLNDDTGVTFSYTVTDGSLTAAGSATLDITPFNNPPVTTPVTLLAIGEDSGPRLITQAELLANATDVDGPSLTATGLTISSGLGTLVDNGDGTWTYTPALNDDSSVSFTYTVTDGSLTAAGTASLDIMPVNDAPTTTPVTLTAIAEDSGPRVITQAELLANASDVDGPSLTATGLTISSGLGTLVDNGDGTWTYTPALDDDTSVSFSYTVTDGTTPVAGSATLDITPVNDPPTTSPVTLAPIAEDSGPRLITQAELLANASDVDGPSLTATGLAISSGLGSLLDNGDGTWTYTPALNDDTGVSFSYTIFDGTTPVAGTASLDITPANDPPTTTPVVLAPIGEDSGPRLITEAELLANATDVDGPSLTATGLAISSGAGALVDNGDGTWTYTPALNDDTSVSFSYTVTDGTTPVAGSATLDITPVNNPPVTTPVTLAPIAEDSGPRLITQAELLANATDIDGPSLTATGLAITAGSGTLVDNGDGTWTYTPALNDDTGVTFSYTVTDGTTPVAGSATLDITPVNDPPATTPVTLVAIGEDSGPRLITQAELLANATDVDGPSLTATGLTISSGLGTLVDNGDGTWTYTPALNDDSLVSFTYTVTDGSLTAVGTATLDITPVNDAPALLSVESTTLQVLATGPAVPIMATLTVDDVDSALLTGATVAVSSNYVSGQDVLGFTDQNGITGSWDVATGVLTLSGSATLADYQAALRSVTYANSSGTPGQSTRTVSLAISDGGAASSLATRDITVTAVTNPVDVLPTTDPLPLPDPVKIDPPPADTPPGGPSPVEEVEDETATPPSPPGDAYRLPGGVEPVVFRVLAAGPIAAGETGSTRDLRRDYAGIPPKFLYDAVDNIRSLLDIDSVGLPRIDNAALWKALDSMSRQMSEFGGVDGRTGAIVGQFTGGAGLVLSIGFVNWVLRGGSLAAAMLSTMPMWRGLDPLPILLARRKRHDDEDEARRLPDPHEETTEIDELFSGARRADAPARSSERHPADA